MPPEREKYIKCAHANITGIQKCRYESVIQLLLKYSSTFEVETKRFACKIIVPYYIRAKPKVLNDKLFGKENVLKPSFECTFTEVRKC